MIPRSIVRVASTAARTRSSDTQRLVRSARRQAWPAPRISPAQRSASHVPGTLRYSSTTKELADEKIEEITELYATAKDEFEIAMEETEKATVYAEDDRTAAKEEFDKVRAAYDGIIAGEDKELAEEVKRRIGQRIRELEQGIKAMEELAQSHD